MEELGLDGLDQVYKTGLLPHLYKAGIGHNQHFDANDFYVESEVRQK